MATIPEVVAKFAQVDGVDVVAAVGTDGLTISAESRTVDADDVAAIVPSLVRACTGLGEVSEHGDFNCAAVEFAGGVAVVANISPEAMIVVLTRPDTNIGPILYALRRYRSALAGLF